MSESNNFLTSKQIGERIKFFRRIKGLSLAEISTHAGVSGQQFQKYEAGHNRISANRLIRISKALEISLDDLLGLNSLAINQYGLYDKNLRKLINNYNRLKSQGLKNLLIHNSVVLVEEEANDYIS